MTNCCDDYGNCRQGRDCPVRKERVERVRKFGEKKLKLAELLEVLTPLVLAALILFAIWLGSIYQQAIRSVS